jgi:signal transduction histidine kinase
MGCSEWVLFKNYFAKDRYETLDQVVNVAKRTAEYLVNSETMPQGAELDALNTKLEIIGESAEAYLFFTDRQGNVLIASDPDKLTTTTVPLDICQRANAVADPDARHYHAFGDLGGALTEKSYIAAVETIDDQSLFSGWLFLCSSGAQLTDFKQQFWSNFLLSACVMLLCASVLTRLLMRQLTDPLQKVTDAAQRFGGGDLSVRVEGVEGDGEVADLARTFNQMAENIQSNDNSQGQFMGNIAHELRTPMTTIKGFVDGILDGTIPPEMQNHYLQLVSEETGRLARLIQNMLDLSKLESGEYQVNARMFNIWETLTGVALIKAHHCAKDCRVTFFVEIRWCHMLGYIGEYFLVNKYRTKQALFGIDVLGWNSSCDYFFFCHIPIPSVFFKKIGLYYLQARNSPILFHIIS